MFAHMKTVKRLCRDSSELVATPLSSNSYRHRLRIKLYKYQALLVKMYLDVDAKG